MKKKQTKSSTALEEIIENFHQSMKEARLGTLTELLAAAESMQTAQEIRRAIKDLIIDEEYEP